MFINTDHPLIQNNSTYFHFIETLILQVHISLSLDIHVYAYILVSFFTVCADSAESGHVHTGLAAHPAQLVASKGSRTASHEQLSNPPKLAPHPLVRVWNGKKCNFTGGKEGLMSLLREKVKISCPKVLFDELLFLSSLRNSFIWDLTPKSLSQVHYA